MIGPACDIFTVISDDIFTVISEDWLVQPLNPCRTAFGSMFGCFWQSVQGEECLETDFVVPLWHFPSENSRLFALLV